MGLLDFTTIEKHSVSKRENFFSAILNTDAVHSRTSHHACQKTINLPCEQGNIRSFSPS